MPAAGIQASFLPMLSRKSLATCFLKSRKHHETLYINIYLPYAEFDLMKNQMQ